MSNVHRWIHAEKRRYYQAELVQDLFGDWTLIQGWGGLDSRRGGLRIVWVPSWEAGLERIEAIGKRRRQRGYEKTRVEARPLQSRGDR